MDVQRALAAADMPPRARRLLLAVQGVVEQSLGLPLRQTIFELEQDLFRAAERARSSQQQADFHAQARSIHGAGEQFAHDYLVAVGITLSQLRETVVVTAEVPPPRIDQAQKLTLVEDVDIDRDIVLQDIARREAGRSANTLQLVAQRLAVIAARPAADVEQLALGPYALTRLLRAAGERLPLGMDGQQLLYRAFDRQVLERLGELLERVNLLLTREGILPGLIFTPYLPRASTRRGAGPGTRASAAASQAPASSAKPLTSWGGQAPAGDWSAAMQAAMQAGAMPSTAFGAASGPAASAVAGTPSGAAPGASFDAPALATLQQLLGAARTQLNASLQAPSATPGAPAGSDAQPTPAHPGQQENIPPPLPTVGMGAVGGMADLPAAQAVASTDLQSMLGRLQGPLASTAPRSGHRSLRDVFSALVAQAQAEHGPQAALSARDQDTFDLLGMLFQQIQREVRPEGGAAGLLARLQVPLARAALQDGAFFVRDQHPARELLNAVAESGANWLGAEDTDPQLQLKLEQVVDRVVSEYDGDESVFTAASEEVQGHFRAAAHKAEVAERRHIEAARGRERLEAAKLRAGQVIEELCARTEPPRFVQSLLRQAWADVLILTLLRNNELSPEWEQRRAASERIAELTCAKPGSLPPDPTFTAQLETALIQVGYHSEEAGAIARRLSTPGGEDEQSSRTELTARLKARTRLGDQKDKTTERAPPPPPRSAAEDAAYRELRGLPFGTWFEFTTNQQGDLRRQRLSWFSLLTDHCLFVNQRGQKLAETTMDAVARLMASGQARVVTEERGRLIDRAWHATMRTLRALAGGSTSETTP